MSENSTDPAPKLQAAIAAGHEVAPVSSVVMATIKAEIVDAILRSQANINALVLGKNDRNKYDGYDYVSVDQFYLRVNPIINEHGLTFKPVLLNWQMVGPDLMLMEVRIDLLFRDGTVVVGYSSFPMVHPMTAPQHTGAALSYAAKIFLRSAFMVATGEADSDALPTGRGNPAGRAQAPARQDHGTDQSQSGPFGGQSGGSAGQGHGEPGQGDDGDDWNASADQAEVQSLHPLERDFMQKARSARVPRYIETWRENNLAKINRLRDSKSDKDRAVYQRLKRRYTDKIRELTDKAAGSGTTTRRTGGRRNANGHAAATR